MIRINQLDFSFELLLRGFSLKDVGSFDQVARRCYILT